MSPIVYNKLNGVDWGQKLQDNFDQLDTAELIELATDAETITGTDATKGVTPAGLEAKVASATAKGIAELATDAETVAITDAARVVTPHGLGAALAKLTPISFVGKNGAGACTLAGVKVGDKVYFVTGLVAADVGSKVSLFESTITVADQIQQSSATDLSTKVFLAFINRLTP